MTGEVIAEAGAVVDRELADAIQNAAVPYVWIVREESDRNIKVLSNMMVDLKAVCGIDPEEVLQPHGYVCYPSGQYHHLYRFHIQDAYCN